MKILTSLGGILIVLPFIMWSVIAFFEKQNGTHYYWKKTVLLIAFPCSIFLGCICIALAIIFFA